MNIYDCIIVIGHGKIAQDVANVLVKMGLEFTLIQSQPISFSTLPSIAKKANLKYFEAKNNIENEEYLLSSVAGRTLVISANNNYLFCDFLTDNSMVDIINFHSALLPNFKGRNAVSWAILYGQVQTGITWHYVDKGIDTGAPIEFGLIDINDSDRAIDLVQKTMLKGIECFNSIIDRVLAGTVETSLYKPEIVCDKLFLSKDIPNKGIIHEHYSVEKMYRIIRSIDYGPFSIFPKLKLLSNEGEYEIESFKYSKQRELGSNLNSVYFEDEFGSLELILK